MGYRILENIFKVQEIGYGARGIGIGYGVKGIGYRV